MSLGISQRQSGSVLVLELKGRLTLGAGSQLLDDTLQNLLAGGQRALLLDCSQVSVIDSQGIKALVRALTSAQRQGGQLKFLKVSPRMREVLELTRLLTVIEAFDDEPTALGSF